MKILFLCTGNSCRSQMAEGWARQLKGDVVEPFSAGVEKHGMNPYALRVMAEAGVDMSGQHSKTVDELGPIHFDYVVTVVRPCQRALSGFSGSARIVHVGFDDPPKLSANLADGEEKLAIYRRVRDEIRRFIEALPDSVTAVGR